MRVILTGILCPLSQHPDYGDDSEYDIDEFDFGNGEEDSDDDFEDEEYDGVLAYFAGVPTGGGGDGGGNGLKI